MPPPPPNPIVLKINCDAAFGPTAGVTGLGIVVRNNYGSILDGLGCRCKANMVEVGEAVALREACTLAVCRSWQHVVFESDALGVIKQVLNSGLEPPFNSP